ncbi:hypothetical protein NDU88_006324 [Pleurodeles waltl]|uniref:DNA (cytosine-5-)-methyltransferase n=1 Tax=Pleurodeles waltl TaxID=8319 RepID=A0AAV7UKN4_PLEWA|nr:hypothetical protein NDU88_006324 [Pleurodeles waltl]
MPCDGPVAVGIQGDVDEPDQAQRQEYDPLVFGALDLVPTNNTGYELVTKEKRTQPDPERNDNRLSCGSIQFSAQRSIPSKKEGAAQSSIHSKKEGAGNGKKQVRGQAQGEMFAQMEEKLCSIRDLKLQPLIERLKSMEAKIKRFEFSHDNRDSFTKPRERGCGRTHDPDGIPSTQIACPRENGEESLIHQPTSKGRGPPVFNELPKGLIQSPSSGHHVCDKEGVGDRGSGSEEAWSVCLRTDTFDIRPSIPPECTPYIIILENVPRLPRGRSESHNSLLNKVAHWLRKQSGWPQILCEEIVTTRRVAWVGPTPKASHWD